jgi:hypothetical protein
MYRIFPHIVDYKDSANISFTPYCFSTVTYTTLGFGDVRPATFAAERPQNSGCMTGRACFETRASARSSA